LRIHHYSITRAFFNVLSHRFANPGLSTLPWAIKYLKVVIPAKAGIQAGALDAGSVIPDLIRDRHDGVRLFNCRVKKMPLGATGEAVFVWYFEFWSLGFV
jgi:hypothetical protein